MKHMVKLVKKHRHMLVICKKVESIYNPIVFFTIIINGLDVCFCVIVLDKVMADEFSNVRRYFADESNNIKHLIELVHKHRDLLSLAQKIEFTYNPVFLATIVFNGINLCLCVIIVDKEISEGEWTLLMKSLIHAPVLATQIFIYCDFSHTVTETIDSIPISLYDSEWVDSTIKLKKMLVIILMQASKQYKFTAYNIVILNREQMTMIFQTTMSYFTLLRNFT
ncbi:odorant receptor 13a-like [Cotesia typhae]|uniref:odorant receptor 13a-like n=1 Tax=Cotesia typhae TaxID=2053667 RepID=UPI003D6851FF